MEHLHAIDLRLLGGALLILAGIASSLLARRFGAPLLLVFLLLGLALGEDGPGGIQYSDTRFTYHGRLAGAGADPVRRRPAHARGAGARQRGAIGRAGQRRRADDRRTDRVRGDVSCSTCRWLEALLLGTIVASTDAAAVFFLLRAGGLHLERRSGATLEIESGSNDPMAVFLVIALTTWLAGDTASDAAPA